MLCDPRRCGPFLQKPQPASKLEVMCKSLCRLVSILKAENATQDSLRSSPCRQHAALGNLREHPEIDHDHPGISAGQP